MNILDINFKKIRTSELKEKLNAGIFISLTNREFKEIFCKFESAIESGDFLIAQNTSIVCVYFRSSEFIDLIKRKGLFRFSKYINKKCIVKNTAIGLIDNYKYFKCLSPKIEIYLNSIINYSTILDSYNSFDRFLLSEIRIFERKYPQKSLIKTLLSFVDFLFLSNYYPEDKTDLSNLSGRTKEEISSAVSFLIYFYTERIKSENINMIFVSEEYIKTSEIARLIIPVCYHLDFREFEILIDYFGYNCQLVNEKLIIRPQFDDFEKAIRLGYIRTDLQKINDFAVVKEAFSFEELVDEINKHKELQSFKLTNTYGYERYILEMPEPLYDFLIEHFIKPDNLFRDEIYYLSSTFKEQLLNFTDLENIKLKDELSLGEFMKIRRVFIIFYMLFAREIYKIEKVDTELLFRSLIPAYPESIFYDLIEKLIPTNKIESFLEIMCWEPGFDTFLDLQYHPILFFDGHFLFALSVFANSDSIRNIYASEYKRNNPKLLKSGEVDPLVDKLLSSLKQATIQCYAQTTLGFTDIDVFAIYGNVLFVFECKHTLHPVSPFDLRTTHDYIKKAEKQLDLIVSDFNSGKLIKRLEDKHRISINKNIKIQGVIVLSNRLFNGNIFKYPVRHISEIGNMLNNGTMRTEKGEFWLWKDKKLSPEFLLEYFSFESELVKLYYDSLSKISLTYEFAEPKIEIETFYLDMEIATTKLNAYTDTLEEKTEIQNNE